MTLPKYRMKITVFEKRTDLIDGNGQNWDQLINDLVNASVQTIPDLVSPNRTSLDRGSILSSCRLTA